MSFKIASVKTLELGDDEFLIVKVEEADAYQCGRIRQSMKKWLGEDRGSRVLVCNGDVQFGKIKMEELSDKHLLGLSDD